LRQGISFDGGNAHAFYRKVNEALEKNDIKPVVSEQTPSPVREIFKDGRDLRQGISLDGSKLSKALFKKLRKEGGVKHILKKGDKGNSGKSTTNVTFGKNQVRKITPRKDAKLN
jgi:hypothetical protein